MPDQSQKSTCRSCLRTASKIVDDEYTRAEKEQRYYSKFPASEEKEAAQKALVKAMDGLCTIGGQWYTGWSLHPDCPDCGVSQLVRGVETVLMV